MQSIIINLRANQITTFWSDHSITWLPLNTYKFKANEDYSVVEQNEFSSGYSRPRIVKGDFLIAMLKKLKIIVDN